MNTPITTGLDKVIDELYEDGIRTGIGINPLDGINCKRRAKQALLALITEEYERGYQARNLEVIEQIQDALGGGDE